MADEGKLTLLGPRLSFASLFEPYKNVDDNGKETLKWKANFLFPKAEIGSMRAIYMGQNMPVMDALKAASEAVKKGKWGEKIPFLEPHLLFFRDGDFKPQWDGYPGHFYISSGADLEEPPKVITNVRDAAGKWIEAAPGRSGAPYSGCFVNAVIDAWAQDNRNGKRLNAKLKAVQFLKDGPAFGAAPVDPNQEFSDDMVGTTGSIGAGDLGGLI